MITWNFSLQDHYIIQQTAGNENIQTYQVAVFVLILYQILITNLKGYVWQLEERIDSQTLGVKGLKVFF